MEEVENLEQSASIQPLAYLVLILTTVLWGTTFIITKNVIQDIPIYFYLGVRFSFSLLIFIPFLYRYKKLDTKTLWYGFLAGGIYAFSIIIQTIGLKTTSAGKGGFITGLNTVIVPFLAWMVYKKRPKNRIWVAVLLSVVGMGFLLLEGEMGINIGDIYVLICAFGFAVYILLVDKHVNEVDIYLYLMVQILVIVISCFSMSFMLSESINSSSLNPEFWLIILYMGCIASGGTFLTQNWGQKKVGPSQTAIIFTLEPVFALIFASFIIGKEVISVEMIIGCALIFSAIVIAVIKKRNKKDQSSS